MRRRGVRAAARLKPRIIRSTGWKVRGQQPDDWAERRPVEGVYCSPAVSWQSGWWWAHTHRAAFLLSAANKTPQQSGDWTPKWSFCMWMSVIFAFICLRRGWGGGSPVPCSVFTPFVLNRNCFFPLSLSFFAYLWICMFASCSFLVVYVFCR